MYKTLETYSFGRDALVGQLARREKSQVALCDITNDLHTVTGKPASQASLLLHDRILLVPIDDNNGPTRLEAGKKLFGVIPSAMAR